MFISGIWMDPDQYVASAGLRSCSPKTEIFPPPWRLTVSAGPGTCSLDYTHPVCISAILLLLSQLYMFWYRLCFMHYLVSPWMNLIFIYPRTWLVLCHINTTQHEHDFCLFIFLKLINLYFMLSWSQDLNINMTSSWVEVGLQLFIYYQHIKWWDISNV